nr:hypothetical protein [Sicyoidochytrium minutum DNA virus]
MSEGVLLQLKEAAMDGPMVETRREVGDAPGKIEIIVGQSDEKDKEDNEHTKPIPKRFARAEAYYRTHAMQEPPMVSTRPDVYPIPGQNWTCYSVLRPKDYGEVYTPDGELYTGTLLKIRGTFDRFEDADDYIRRLQVADPHHEIKLVKTHQWIPFDDELDAIHENREYQDETVREVMKGYFERERKRVASVSARMARFKNHDDLVKMKEEGERLGLSFAEALDPDETHRKEQELRDALLNANSPEVTMKGGNDSGKKQPTRPGRSLSDLARQMDREEQQDSMMDQYLKTP